MASTYATPSTLTGLFKEVYGDEVNNLIPDASKLQKMIPFVSRDKELGNIYHQPVILTQEHGIAYADYQDGAFALSDHISMNMADAQIRGSQMCLRSALSYDAAARASNSKKAFVKGTELLIENMIQSVSKRLEIALIYGGVGIATVDTSAASGTTGADDYVTATCSAASWALGIFAGLENARVNVYTGSSKVGTNYKVDTIDLEARTFKLKPAVASTDNVATIASKSAHTIYFAGAYGKEMKGLDAIITNTGSLFNIDASVYSLWKGNSVTVSGQLTMGKVLSSVSKAVLRGLDEKAVCLLNPDAWANLNVDQAALRKYDGSFGKEAKNGFESIKFFGQNGEIELVPHNIVKAGEAFIFPPKRCKRIGAQEISFRTPGREDEIFLHLANNAGFELRVYTDQALFVEAPAKCVKISGFANV